MITTARQPSTVEPVERRILTIAERRPVKRPENDERTAILSEQVAVLMKGGYTVEYESPFGARAVLVRNRRFRSDQRIKVAVDEWGVLTVD